MTIEEIKEFLEENKQDPEVNKLVEQLSDRRVNQALSKWSAELPDKIEQAIAERNAQLEIKRSKVEQVHSQINNKLAEAKIERSWIEPFLPEDLENFAENAEALDGFMEKTIGTINSMKDKFLKDKFSTTPPAGGSVQKELDPDQIFIQRAKASALKG